MTFTYQIEGMTCMGCKVAVYGLLNDLSQVKKVSVNLEKAEVNLEMDQGLSLLILQDALPDKYSILEKIKVDQAHKYTPSAIEENNLLKQLFPLFLIFALIIVVAVLLQYKAWGWTEFMLDFMGLFYLVFSFFKFLDLKGFPTSFRMYDPLANIVPAYGLIYPFIELTLGFMFLMRFQIPLALITTLCVLGITTYGVVKALLNKTHISCACLGTILKLPMTRATFIENSIMIIMALIMLINTYAL